MELELLQYVVHSTCRQSQTVGLVSSRILLLILCRLPQILQAQAVRKIHTQTTMVEIVWYLAGRFPLHLPMPTALTQVEMQMIAPTFPQ